MAVAAEPLPASLPLPGGRPGAALRLHPLLAGDFLAPDPAMHREEGRRARLRALGVGVPEDEWRRTPIVSFLVEHPEAGPVLIDTGLHGSVAVDPAANLGRVGNRVLRDLRTDPGQAVTARLRVMGIDAAAVRVVVMTHLHIDHASAMADFPAATFVISAPEWAAATTGSRPTLHGYRARQFDHALDLRLVDFDGPEADSFATFGRSLDLFGDGSVRLVSTPGHTLGHMSVVLRLAGREALIVGDAAYTRRTLDTGHLPARLEDEHLFRRSLRELQRYAEATPGALVIPGHDMAAWSELKPVY